MPSKAITATERVGGDVDRRYGPILSKVDIRATVNRRRRCAEMPPWRQSSAAARHGTGEPRDRPLPRLVVIDVQNECFTGNLPIEFPPVATKPARTSGGPWTRPRPPASRWWWCSTRPRRAAPIFDKGTPGWDLHPEIARRPHDHHVHKRQASVFTGTEVRRVGDRAGHRHADHRGLHDPQLRRVHRDAGLAPGPEGGVPVADATGALPYENAAGRVSAEEIHRAFSVVLHSNFAAVATTDQWLAALKAGEALPMDNVPMSNRRARGTAAGRAA